MGEHPLRQLGKTLALSAGYCALFLFFWHHSFDQWYLPAGLRLAGMLLLPPRYRVGVFAGDTAALLVLRIPKAAEYSIQWAYLSPFMFIPLYALTPLGLKRWANSPTKISTWLSPIAIIAVCWSTACAMTLNQALSGPKNETTLENFIRYSAGDIMGIMMILLPCLLWIRRKEWHGTIREIAQNSAISSLMIAALYAIAMQGHAMGSAIQLMPLIFMILPVFFLTVMHGWHGAALGMVLVNFAIALALPRAHIAGIYDQIVFIAQISLFTLSTGLLFVGNRITKLFTISTEALLEKLQAIQSLREQEESGTDRSRSMLKTLFRSNELQLRENVVRLGAARHNLDRYRHSMAKTFKDDGQYERAMEAMSVGMEDAKSLDMYRDSLYPFEIETHGLYAALMGPAFHDTWREHARIYQNFKGNQRYLSLTLRLAVYRAINRAMESMRDNAPNEYDIRIRAWRRSMRSGATILITCNATRDFAGYSQVARDAFEELRARVFAFDGTLKRRHRNRIHFMMTEISETEGGP